MDYAGFGYTTIEFFAPLANLDGIGATIERHHGNHDSAGLIETEVLKINL